MEEINWMDHVKYKKVLQESREKRTSYV